MGSGLGPFAVSCEYDYGSSDPITCREFLDYPRNCYLLWGLFSKCLLHADKQISEYIRS
jgi:hypothetical protein